MNKKANCLFIVKRKRITCCFFFFSQQIYLGPRCGDCCWDLPLRRSLCQRVPSPFAARNLLSPPWSVPLELLAMLRVLPLFRLEPAQSGCLCSCLPARRAEGRGKTRSRPRRRRARLRMMKTLKISTQIRGSTSTKCTS